MATDEPCEVISFYSYNGGSGRSMALANVACLLARRCTGERGVLMIDWNLESPSLHRFFQEKVRTWTGSADPGTQPDSHPGLLDLFLDLEERITKPGASPDPGTIFDQAKPTRFVIPTDIPSLFFLKAGKFDDYYFSAVSGFQFSALHERAPWIITSLLDSWARHYRFILIDSASGVNDMSGLCAMMIPDKLVTVFTPSRQSLMGALDVMRCAADYRQSSGSARPLAIFPLPSKIEVAEPEMRNDWRYGGPAGDPEGYQARFETLLRELQPGVEISLEAYFTDVRIPYVPRYSYGDAVAAAAGVNPSECPLVNAYRNLSGRLRQTQQPWSPYDPSADLSVMEIDGRMLPLAEAQDACLKDIQSCVAVGDHLKAGEALATLAQIQERLGKPEEAESHYLEAVAQYRVSHHDAGVAGAIAGLARLERLLGRSQQARCYYLDAVNLYRSDRRNKLLAQTLSVLGDVDLEVGETKAAAEHYREAIEWFENDWDDTGVARTLVRLSDLEKRTGALDDAGHHYRQAARIMDQQRDNRGLAAALSNLAEVHSRTGRNEQAEDSYLRAAKLYRAERDTARLAHTLRCLAGVSRTLKKPERAVEYYLEAVDLFRQEGEHLGLAIALQSLAELSARCGKLADAQSRYAEATVLYRQAANNLGVANTLRGLGDLSRRSDDFNSARIHYAEAMELYRVEGSSLGLANSLQSLGDLERRTGKIEEAQEHYTQAIQIYRAEGARLGLANALKSLGDTETEAGNLDLGEVHYHNAIELYRGGGWSLGLANAQQRLGDLKRLQQRYKEAMDCYSTARDLYRQDRQMSGLAYTCSEMARVAHALFDFGASIEYLSEAIAAANESTSPAVIEYVCGVQRELRWRTVAAAV